MTTTIAPVDFTPLLEAIAAKAAKLNVNTYGDAKVLAALADLSNLADALHAYSTNAAYAIGRVDPPLGVTIRAAQLREAKAAKRVLAMEPALRKTYKVKAAR